MSQSPDNIENIVTRTSTVWLGEDGIFRIIHFPNMEVTLADAEETLAAYLKLYQGKRCPLYVDSSNLTSLSREARHLYAGEEAARVASAVGILVGTPVSKVVGNFFLGLSTPQMPTQLFTAEDEALQWLKGYIE